MSLPLLFPVQHRTHPQAAFSRGSIWLLAAFDDLLKCLAYDAGALAFRIADLTSFKDLLASKASIGGRRDKTILFRNTFGRPDAISPRSCAASYSSASRIFAARSFRLRHFSHFWPSLRMARAARHSPPHPLRMQLPPVGHEAHRAAAALHADEPPPARDRRKLHIIIEIERRERE